jgi:hypothetical protein
MHFTRMLPVSKTKIILKLNILKADIGADFKSEMTEWFVKHPEVVHTWSKNELTINHPKIKDSLIVCKFTKDFVEATYGNNSKIFKKELFKRTPHVISDIFVYIFNELIKEEDTEIKKPIISEESFAVLHCNQRFGHVLTVNKNLFAGWGEVFKVFENLSEAQRYCESNVTDEIELSIYDSKYNCIEQYR